MTGADDPGLTNPYAFLLKFLVTHVVKEMPGNEKIRFIFDDQAEKKIIRDSWLSFMEAAPELAQARVRDFPSFEDDKEFLPLQSADFLAWRERVLVLTRQGKMLHRPLPYDIDNVPNYLVSRMVWDERRLTHFRETMLKRQSARFSVGYLP